MHVQLVTPDLAARELLREAWAAPEVQAVLAHTLAGPSASVRVLEKTGFVHDGAAEDDDVGALWRFAAPGELAQRVAPPLSTFWDRDV